MSRIFWDSNLFIYLFEDKGKLAERVVSLRKRMTEHNDELLTSTFMLGEILVKPLELGNEALARRHEQKITASATGISFDRSAAHVFAILRLDRTIQPPDAIQLACAAAAGVDLFITNDSRLNRKVEPGIHFIQAFATATL